jgi:hypothetical protein
MSKRDKIKDLIVKRLKEESATGTGASTEASVPKGTAISSAGACPCASTTTSAGAGAGAVGASAAAAIAGDALIFSCLAARSRVGSSVFFGARPNNFLKILISVSFYS